ncbi:MAG: polysaccharide deacetylase family protein [Gemmatimonadales bacterium]
MKMNEDQISGPRRDFVGYGRHIPKVSWPDEARVAVNLVINYEEGSEVQMSADGRNESILGEMSLGLESQYRDLALESVYEYGARAGIWRLQRMFDSRSIPTTVFAAAVALERNLEVARWLRDSEHEICSHGWRWEEVWRLTRDDERAHIDAAVKSFEETCGRRPLGWYCRYGPSVHTRELLVEEGGFTYDADAYNDDLPYTVEVLGRRHLIVPYSFTYNDARFVASQGYGSPSDFLDNIKRGFDYLWEEGESHPRMMSIGLHPRLVGQASRAGALAEFLDYARKKGGVWFARRIDIAEWWNDHFLEFALDIQDS